MKTKVINLFAGSGAGKSTTAAHLYALMKQRGHNVELVREYVKSWAWEGRKIVPSDQLYILSKQLKQEKVLYGKLDYVITDSPVLLCAYYDHKHSGGKENFTKYLVALEEELSASKHNLNFFINRSKPFDPKGRYETEEQAKVVDVELRSYLDKYFNIKPIEILDEDEKKAEAIYNIVTMYKGGLTVP